MKSVARRSKMQFNPSIPKVKEIKDIDIRYKRPKKHVEKIKKSLKKPRMNVNKVGEYTFDYYLKNVSK